MQDDAQMGLPRETLEELLIETIGHLGPDDTHFTRKLAAGIAEVIDRNNRELAKAQKGCC